MFKSLFSIMPSFASVTSSLRLSGARRLALAVIMALGAGAVADAEVAIQREGDHFQVIAEKYQATFNLNGALLTLKVGGEEFMAKLPELPASYFYRGSVILPEDAEGNGNTLSAKGNGVEWRWEFMDDEILLHVSNFRRQAVRFFVLFSGTIEEVSTGSGDGFSVPHKADPVGDVVLRRASGALEVSGGKALDAFRGQQVYTLGLETRGSAVLKFKVQ